MNSLFYSSAHAGLNNFSLTVLFIAGFIMCADAQATSQAVTPTQYKGVSVTYLLDVYKEAHVQAGFQFKDHVVRPQKMADGRSVSNLVFEFIDAIAPHKKKATVEFVVYAPASGEQSCAPCAVFPASFPGYLPDRSSRERDIFVEKVTAAYRRANARIRSRLGASVPSP